MKPVSWSRIITLVVALAVLMGGLALPTTVQAQNNYGLITVATISTPFRGGPGDGFWVIRWLGRGQSYPVLGRSADGVYWLIQARGVKGYVMAADVTAKVGDVPVASSEATGVVLAGQAFVRFGPGTQYGCKAILTAGAQFFIIGRSPDGTWLQIRFKYGKGWLAASVTNVAPANVPPSVPPTTDVSGGPAIVVRTGTLNVRSGPGVQYPSIGTLAFRASAPIIGQSADGSWLQIQTPFGNGWVSKGYVNVRNYNGSAPVVAAPNNSVAGSIATGAANIRRGPAVDFESIGTLGLGAVVSIVGQSPDRMWWLVETPMGRGWISKAVVRTAANAAMVPVVNP